MTVQRYELEALSSDVFRLTVSEGTDGVGGSRDVWLTLGQPLDRELQSSYALTITAYDGGTPPKSGSVDIQVNSSDYLLSYNVLLLLLSREINLVSYTVSGMGNKW